MFTIRPFNSGTRARQEGVGVVPGTILVGVVPGTILVGVVPGTILVGVVPGTILVGAGVLER